MKRVFLSTTFLRSRFGLPVFFGRHFWTNEKEGQADG